MEAKAARKLQDGAEYDALITPADSRDRLIAKQGGVPDTLELVRRVAVGYRSEVSKLAEKLVWRLKGIGPGNTGPALESTCRNIWDFVYQHIQYHLDEPGLEQVRHPARSWADRVHGVDCEDYAVFISAILQNLQIPHLMRISAYKGGWQHIYIIVPRGKYAEGVDPDSLAKLPTKVFEENYKGAHPDKPHLLRKDYITLDCVTDQYDFEVAPSKTMNLPMPALYELSGLDEQPAIGREVPEQLVISYPSASGHTVAIGSLGGYYVKDDGDLGELDDLGAVGRFKPVRRARKVLAKKGKRLSTKVKRGGLIRKLVGKPALFRNPADIPGATNIAATWVTQSNHLAGIDFLGNLYVMDHNDRLAELGALSGLDVNDPELSGWLKKAFKKVGGAVKKASSAVSNAVQKGVLDNLNKIPGVKYVADHYGSEILQAAAGMALTAVTGGAAAPALVAMKVAKGASIAAKVAKAAKLAASAKKAISAATKLKKVAKAVSLAKKAVKVVKFAKKVSALIPRNAQTGAAETLTDNPQPLSFLPADPNQVQDHSNGVMPNLLQVVPEQAASAATSGPTIPLSPETADYSSALAVRSTASVVEPTEPTAEDEEGTYATDVTEGDEQPQYALTETNQEVNGLAGLGLNSGTLWLAGGGLLAAGLVALAVSGNEKPARRRSSGLAGTPRRKAAKGKAAKSTKKARTIRL